MIQPTIKSVSLQGMCLRQRSRKSMVVPALTIIRYRVLQSSGMKLSGNTQNMFLSKEMKGKGVLERLKYYICSPLWEFEDWKSCPPYLLIFNVMAGTQKLFVSWIRQMHLLSIYTHNSEGSSGLSAKVNWISHWTGPYWLSHSCDIDSSCLPNIYSEVPS